MTPVPAPSGTGEVMTAIAGIVEQGRVYIGGDSAGTDGRYGQQVRSDRKVFRKDDFIFGGCGSARVNNLLRFRLDPPKPYDWEDLANRDHALAFMSTRFVEVVRSCLREYGAQMNVHGESQFGAAFLVGFRGCLYKVDGDYQVAVSEDPFDATGAGEMIALGSLHSTVGTGLGPQRRLEMALQAASRYNASVRPPFVIESL